MRAGRAYEDLVAEVLRALSHGTPDTVVERDVRVPGPDGPRQVDVLLRATSGPFELVTIIECKDHQRKVDVTRVDALHSVMGDLNASSSAIVSRAGFSKGAISKAQRLGRIKLFRADDLRELPDLVHAVPVLIHELAQVSIEVVGTFVAEFDTLISRDAWAQAVAQSGLAEAMRRDLQDEAGRLRLAAGAHRWVPSDPEHRTVHVRDRWGLRHPIRIDHLGYTVRERWFLGHLSDLDAATALKDEIQGRTDIVLWAEELGLRYRDRFTEIRQGDPLPEGRGLMMTVAVAPEPGEQWTTTIGGPTRRPSGPPKREDPPVGSQPPR